MTNYTIHYDTKDWTLTITIDGVDTVFGPLLHTHDAVTIIGLLHFTLAAHGDQKRKYTNEPYIVHPLAVAAAYYNAAIPPSFTGLHVAFLHDVLEDTPVTTNRILSVFGGPVLHGVAALTKPTEGNRKERHQKYIEQLRMSPNYIKVIKVLDMTDNISTIAQYDPKFARTYLQETMQTFEAIQDHGHDDINERFLSVHHKNLQQVDEWFLQQGLEKLESKRK